MRRRDRLAFGNLLVLAALGLPPPSGKAEAGSPSVVRMEAALDSLVPKDATIEKVTDGFTWVEGPLWNARLTGLLFSDVPNNAIHLWRPGSGTSRFLFPSSFRGTGPFRGREPGSNGVAFDAEGRLLLCAHGDRAIIRIERNGERTVLADRFEGRRLNSPNDLVVRANGDVVFTDPPFGLPGTFRDAGRELPFSGVFRLGANGGLVLLTKALRAPNGLAFSPDGRLLYVSNAETERAIWMAFPFRPDGLSLPAGSTALYDAIYLACDEKLVRETGRKTIVVLSDGDDSVSRSTLNQALEMALRAEATIFSISVNRGGFFGTEGFTKEGDRIMKQLS